MSRRPEFKYGASYNCYVGEMEEDYFYVIAVIFGDPTDIPIIVE